MPKLSQNPSPQELYQAYSEGMKGWLWNTKVEREWNRFASELPPPETTLADIKDTHKKHPRVLLYLSRTKYDPKAYEEEPQTGPDCTSHGDRNARDTTRAVEIDIKGEAEQYFLRGATEPSYGARGGSFDGSDPATLARFVHEVGWLVRQNYPGVVDLSKYNFSIGDKWGRRGVPEEVKTLCREHNVGELVIPRQVTQCLDCIANGYAGHSGQSWGTSAEQPKDGINRKSESWGHDMANVGYDYSLEFFKEPVFLVPNTWGKWNKPNKIWLANQDVYGPWIPGMIIVSFDEFERYFVKSGSIQYYADIKGFPRKTLPKFHTGVL